MLAAKTCQNLLDKLSDTGGKNKLSDCCCHSSDAFIETSKWPAISGQYSTLKYNDSAEQSQCSVGAGSAREEEKEELTPPFTVFRKFPIRRRAVTHIQITYARVLMRADSFQPRFTHREPSSNGSRLIEIEFRIAKCFSFHFMRRGEWNSNSRSRLRGMRSRRKGEMCIE